MIQTLAENGIKHGISKLTKGGRIFIQAFVQDNVLCIKLVNSGNYDENKAVETGFGLVNTKQRLQLLFGNKANFEIKNLKNEVEVVVLIPSEIIQFKHDESNNN